MTAVEQPVAHADAAADAERWVPVCAVESVRPDRGVAVLVDDRAVAVFRLSAIEGGNEEWHAVGHIDPVTGAPVIARGLVGTVDIESRTVPTVASPLHKQRYDLRTGACLDDPDLSLQVFTVRSHDGVVEIGAPVTPT